MISDHKVTERSAPQAWSILSVAPMMDWTDRHCRYFMRLLSPNARLYTEMLTAQALVYGDADTLLRFDRAERPVALQLGGSDPGLMAAAARKGEAAGYDEININVGCPSDRVQSGQFGACLMASPAIVAECVQAIRAVVAVPVTIKCRIGIDDRDDVEFLHEFVRTTHSAGCDTFIVHARKAILSGLSPKENRSVPPLCHDRVYGLKSAFPGINVVINGGITSVDDCRVHLERVDGVMIGRAAYHSPWLLTDVERKLFGGSFAADRQDVVAQMSAYAQREVRDGTPIRHIARHMLGLYAGQPGARAWRRTISELAYGSGATADVFTLALRKMECVA